MSKLNGPNPTNASGNTKTSYVMAVICLVIGLAVGYFIRGSATTETVAAAAPLTTAAPSASTQAPEQLKQMADKQAEPLLKQLQVSPNDSLLLSKIGNIYYDSQQYKEAIGYYDRSLALKPDNADVRTDYATVYWYLGDANKAISEFEKALSHNPNHPGALFNMGVVKWQGKGDAEGAVAAWQKLMKVDPAYAVKANVPSLIAKAREHGMMPPGAKTDKPATM